MSGDAPSDIGASNNYADSATINFNDYDDERMIDDNETSLLLQLRELHRKEMECCNMGTSRSRNRQSNRIVMPSLITSIYHVVGKNFLITGILKLGNDLVTFLQPIILKYVKQF